MDTLKSKKEEQLYGCKKCDFKCSKKYNLSRHCLTDKHTRIHFGYILDTKEEQKEQKEQQQIFSCNCGNKYKYSQGLSKHKQKCNNIKEENLDKSENLNKQENLDKPENKEDLINYLIKENQEFKSLILEIVKKDTSITNNNNTNTISNSNINSNNKTFNLNFFLNETCKNAMNISDFVDSIKLQLTDLESVSRLGYVDGLSKIIIKNLNALDVTERPVHCSDPKRDTMYVKDEDKWEKEAEDNHIVLKAIEDIANKNSKQVKEWKIKNPECSSSKSNKSDQYCHILMKVVCSNNDDNNAKVLKKIAKEVTIDKNKN